jgi:hypothetical protein
MAWGGDNSRKDGKVMGLSIDTTRSYPLADSSSYAAPEPTKEQKLAALLWKSYGMDAYRHAAHMCAKEQYKKIGYSCDKVVEALDVLAERRAK